MPKVSLLAKDATKGGGGFGAQEGWWEIGKCYSTAYEFPQSEEQKAKREKPNAATMIILELFKLDSKTYERVDEEEAPVVERLGFGAKNGLDVLRPGKMKNANDTDVEDLGTELGVEGNTIYGEEGVKLSDNCAWIIFSNSAEKHGFDPTKIGTGYLPYFEGTKFEVERLKGFKPANLTEKQKAKYEKYGDPTNLAVKNIAVFGYDKAGKGASKGAKASSNGADKSNHVAESEVDTSAAIAAIQDIIAANTGKTLKKSVFQANFMTYLMRKTQLDKKGRDVLMTATVKDDEWLATTSAEYGFVVDFDSGTVEFLAG